MWVALAVILLIVGFAAGYSLSTSWGDEQLREEVESILADLLEGEVEIDEVQIVLSDGIGLQGRGVRVYPSERGHALYAETAYIELKEPALALGELELALLVLEDAVLQLSLGEDGRWSFPPLQAALDEDRTPESDAPAKPVLDVLDVLAGAEEVARFLLEEEHIADRIILRRGAVHFEDHSVTADARPGTKLQRFHLQHIEGILSWPWLSDDGQLALTTTFVDPNGNEGRVRCTSFVADGAVEIALAGTDLDLNGLSPYVQRLSAEADIDGKISGELRLEASEPGYQHIRADLALRQVAATVVLADEPARIEIPMDILHARLEVEPTIVRLVDTRFQGSNTSLDFEAGVERPIDWGANARLRAVLSGLSVQDVRPILDQGPERVPLQDWFGGIESGTVDRLSLSGRTTFSTWGQLLDGELARLPDGFLVGVEVSDMTATIEGGEQLESAGFSADWAADRLELRRGAATWRGQPLPELNFTVDGVSHFVGMNTSSYQTNAAPLPGLPLLWDLLASDDGDPTPYRFHVDVDYLDHPILQWPIEDAHMTLQSIPGGSESRVNQATWGGFPVVAEVIYLLEPEPVLTIGIQASRNATRIVHEDEDPAPERRAGGPWGRGRFRLEPGPEEEPGQEDEPMRPLSRMSGEFTLSESSVRLSGVEVTVSSNAHIAADIAVDLGDENVLPVALQGRLDDADFAEVGPAIGLPERFVTGRVEVDADIVGHLERGQNLYAGLTGTIRASARDGKIRQNVPIAVKIATATDGFNPFAKSDKLKYQTIETELALEDGRLTANRLELEGPVRIYATGTLDFARPPQEIDAVVGVFLFQRIRELLGMVPLVNLVVPGSDKGMVGAYFRVRGPWDDPDVDAMKLKSFKEELPDIITAPVDFIQWLWKTGNGKPASSGSR